MNKIDALRGFLLGTLSDRDREMLESSVLSDDALYELLLSVEEDLIDETVRGELPPAEAKSFLHYLARTPDGARRLELARCLKATLEPSTRPAAPEIPASRPWPSRGDWLAWAATIAVLIAGGLSAAAIWSLRSRVAELDFDVARAEAREAELIAELREARTENRRLESASRVVDPRPAPDAVPVLSEGTLRSGGTVPKVSVSPEKDVFQLSLDLGADSHETYRAVLHDVDGREWVALSRLRARHEAEEIRILLAIPTRGLGTGDYYVFLSGVGPAGEKEPLARYDFRLTLQ
jgi:hypothetical protein